MPTYLFSRQHALSAIHMILTKVQPKDLFVAHTSTLERAVKVVTINTVALKLKESLLSDNLIDDILGSELCAPCYSLVTPKGFSPNGNFLER